MQTQQHRYEREREGKQNSSCSLSSVELPDESEDNEKCRH